MKLNLANGFESSLFFNHKFVVFFFYQLDFFKNKSEIIIIIIIVIDLEEIPLKRLYFRKM